MKKRILLVQCGADDRHIDTMVYAFEAGIGPVEYASMTPLSCATLAALTPDDYEVEIWDENLRGQIRADTAVGRYDIVGISLMFSALAYQARFLALLFKGEGATVVVGGPAVSAAPEEFRELFDVVFVNEAERTWPQFLRDFARGEPQREYRQIEKPGLDESPAPRWGSVAATIPRYEWATVQTTRGCPFDCEFCDVIYLFGRKQRHKPVGQVIDEVRALEALGTLGVFFADDEFIGDAAYAKEVLSALIPVNRAFRRPLRFFTQLTMNLSRDDELLEMIADANFYTAVLGIESFNHDSLRETRKNQNIRKDIIADIQKIQSYGIGPRGSFIVGFDHDGPEVFEQLFEGIQRACLPWIAVSPLHAPHNTPLWARLHADGRIARLRRAPGADFAKVALNIIPAGMSRPELLEGYRDLVRKVSAWEAVCERIRGWAAMVRRPPRVTEPLLTSMECERFLADARTAWQLTPSEHAAIGDTVAQARSETPHLINRVVFFLAKCQFERKRHGPLFEGYDRLLDAERRGDLVRERRPLLIPPAFGKAMTGLFPELYARIHRSLPDKQLVPEASKEVLVDFLVRWGATFAELEPHHRAFLLELCDRASAKRGGAPAPASPEEERTLAQEARRTRLLDAVLKDVRDELALISAA